MFHQIVFITALYLLLGLFECLFPVERKQPTRERFRNLALTGIFFIVGSTATLLLLQPLTVTPTTIAHPLFLSILIIFLGVLLTDVIFYLYHRAQHTIPALWAIHELHHSDANMNATTSLRTHWLEHTIQAAIIGFPVSLVIQGNSLEMFFVGMIITLWLFFTHANWRLSLGRATSILTGPQLHRIHHSRLPQHQDKNFAQIFPILDRIFGTYYAPAQDEFPPTGTTGLPTNVSIQHAFLHPFLVWLGKSKS